MSSQRQDSDLQLSPLDCDRFQLRIGRAEQVAPGSVETLLLGAAELDLDLVIARCPAGDLLTAADLADAGFRFLDADIHFAGPAADIAAGGLPSPPVSLRPATPADFEAVLAIATEAFSGHPNHYRADPRLDREGVDAIYPDWARRCVSGEATDLTLVAEIGSRVAGFSSFRLNSEEEAQLLLGAVAGWASGRRIYSLLTIAGARWAAGQGRSRLLCVTQLGNVAAQRSWVLAGLQPVAGVFTFHLWRR